jgi:hypothetical protein
MTDNEEAKEKLYDIKADPKEMDDISSAKPKTCRRLRKRIWYEMGGDPLIYDVIRHGHECYEYLDIHDPTGTFSKSLVEKRYARVKK